MIKKILVIVILSLMVACGSSTPTEIEKPMTAKDYVNEFGGDESVYTEIMNSNDCEYLRVAVKVAQHGVDKCTKMYNTKCVDRCVGYMSCSIERMKTIRCYK